ncbi:MAG: hypothetical protein IT423_20035 [Pirellulaceae bacterium]|nr:hypothetical protein [Pirellulaceae bacterium]
MDAFKQATPNLSWYRLCAPVAILVLALSLSGGTSHADFLTVVNHSFEDISGETVVNEFTFGPLNGWQLYDPNSITNGGAGNTFFIGTLTPTPPTFFTSGTTHGQRMAIAFNFFGSGGQGEYGLQQTLSSTLQPLTTYQLQVDIGNIASGTSLGGDFFPLAGFPGYRVDLIAGGQVLVSDNNLLAGSIAEGTFASSLIQFTTDNSQAQLGQSLSIRLVNLNIVDPAFPNSDLEVDFDNVRLNAISAVPEPLSAIAMIGLTVPAIMQWRKRRSRGRAKT